MFNSKYVKHDVTDWIGERTNDNELNGFKWQGGKNASTSGIWIWSHVYTHDFDNGDKVAIILLDTQGIFDTHTSLEECRTIFGLTTLLSSVQLFNVEKQIQEDDLQHLDLFTGYANYVLEQSNEKAFQKLHFIVRDWPFPQDNGYGWEGKKVVDEIMAGDAQRTNQMRELRERINSSFEEISAFLMPHPGMTVAVGNKFTGDLKQIDAEFLTYVNQLVPEICAPKNLVIKKINGRNVRARNLVQYFKDYLDIFNTMPPPETLFEVNVYRIELFIIGYERPLFLNNEYQIH